MVSDKNKTTDGFSVGANKKSSVSLSAKRIILVACKQKIYPWCALSITGNPAAVFTDLPYSMIETGIRDVLTCVFSFTILWRMVIV